ncbi:MAG: 16S rRNA (cytidine(1402)-2'-O)-methyltransferase [bacterium]
MLFVVATPIGNLADITLRAIDTLKQADLIVAEDTRHAGKLLQHYQIKRPAISFHQHSSPGQLKQIIDHLQRGESVALITDAGTPGIADPGQKLVAAAQAASVRVVPIPGPSSVTAILSVAGIDTDAFMFVGWLPKKKGRSGFWDELRNLSVPIVLFESPMRLLRTLQDIKQQLGDDKTVIIGRELTKLHEEVLRLPIPQAIDHFTQHPPRGEFVIVIT